MAIKILLDTDIGSDIDDAVCLAYLLANPDCDLLGVTTVSGQADRRAMMVSAMCRAAGVRVPILPGVQAPVIIGQKQPECPQAKALERWPHDRDFPRGEAVEFLRRTIDENPGDVVLLTIGPLTNAALLFATHPELASKLKALVMMCGVFTAADCGPGATEWNAVCDPHATAVAYAAAASPHRSIGLDVTRRVTMSAEEVRQRFAHDLLAPVLDFAEDWFARRSEITFHDPLAAVTIFDDQVCRFERGTVEVDLADPKLLGMTRWSPGEGPHEVALEVDAERFFEDYFAVFD